MDNNEIFISSALMDKYSSMAESNTKKLDETRETNDSGFSSLKDNGIYTKGFNKIGSRLTSITNTIKNTNNINKAYIGKFVTLEAEGKRLAEELIVPKIDNTRSINLVNHFASTNISKEDGKSVNSGIDTLVDNNLIDKYYEDKELLGDITKEDNVKEEELDDYIDLNKELLTSIDKDSNTLEVELEDYTLIKEELLKKVNSDINTYEVKMNDIELERVDINNQDKYSDEVMINLNDYINSNRVELSDIKEVNE